MKQFFTCSLALFIWGSLSAQNSLLVNFGNDICNNNTTTPEFSIINNPLSGSSTVINKCSMVPQLPDVYDVFIAYNPKDNKIYIADISDHINTKIWRLNVGLPKFIVCPSPITVAPTYSYNYVSNNFEFDNNGNLWSLSKYNAQTGSCNLDKFDVNTGRIINTRILQFPARYFPTSVNSGDITIMPNGRMFAVLGTNPCQLYEITNYNTTTPAAASFLKKMTKSCYAMSYLNGHLELSGTDFRGSCYYFDYNIVNRSLGVQKTFQNGQMPIDNTSITPTVGTTKRLLGATMVNANTADIVYEVYVVNMGNVVLNNINVSDDLVSAFGNGNVVSARANFSTGANAGGLLLNPAFNGTNNKDILAPNQDLKNNISTNQDYFFKVTISCRVTNLLPNKIYYNSAIGRGNIGAGMESTQIDVSDSSNNGLETVVDPNKNGIPSEIGENVPTPYFFGSLLPVQLLDANASLAENSQALINWRVATPLSGITSFETEYSIDKYNWMSLGHTYVTDQLQSNYQFTARDVPQGNTYYRIKLNALNGTFTYSKIIMLGSKTADWNYAVFPNPANNSLQISAPEFVSGHTTVEMLDAVGKKITTTTINSNWARMDIAQLPIGNYIMRFIHNGEVKLKKIIIKR